MNDPLYNQLREVSWRRKLTDVEEAQLHAFLAAHPEVQAEWEEEIGLDQLLYQLPEIPVASNFTARIVQTLRAEKPDRSVTRLAWWELRWLGWLPKAAPAVVVLCLGLLGYRHHRDSVREKMAESLPNVTSVISLHSPDIWENFDEINKLSHTQPQADVQLLALLQ